MYSATNNNVLPVLVCVTVLAAGYRGKGKGHGAVDLVSHACVASCEDVYIRARFDLLCFLSQELETCLLA